jgi:hypothetical protein
MWRGLGAPPLIVTTRFLAARVARQPLGGRGQSLNGAAHRGEDEYAGSDNDDGTSTLALVLGALGAGLGAVALIVSLARRRA